MTGANEKNHKNLSQETQYSGRYWKRVISREYYTEVLLGGITVKEQDLLTL
jgi:hypothetical protein